MNFKVLFQLYSCLIIILLSGQSNAHDYSEYYRWQLDDVLQSDDLPFAIGHRGYGENSGEVTDKPIENTVKSVRRAFREGVQIVEVDVVLSKDNKVIALHDDYLNDLTCVNSLTFRQLKERLPKVSSLKQVLRTARRFSFKRQMDRPRGQVIIEIKTPSPICDPTDSTSAELVANVVKDIQRLSMNDQVLVESFSPEILSLVKQKAENLPVMLTLSALQLLSVEQIEAITGLPVTFIDKSAGFNLQWAEIGPFFRLPGYLDVTEYVQTILLTNSRAASLDSLFLAQAEQIQAGAGSGFIEQLHLLGLNVLVYTIDTEADWLFVSNLGADGIYTNDIPLGIMLEGL